MERSTRSATLNQRHVTQQQASVTVETSQSDGRFAFLLSCLVDMLIRAASSDTRPPATAQSVAAHQRVPDILDRVQRGRRSGEMFPPLRSPDLERNQNHASRPAPQLATESPGHARENDPRRRSDTDLDDIRFLPTPEDLNQSVNGDSVRPSSLSGRESHNINMSIRGLDLFDASFLDAFHFEGDMGLNMDTNPDAFSIHLDDLVYGGSYFPH